jgi:hypothetical protein
MMHYQWHRNTSHLLLQCALKPFRGRCRSRARCKLGASSARLLPANVAVTMPMPISYRGSAIVSRFVLRSWFGRLRVG